MKDIRKLSAVALGTEAPDLVFKNANIINVFTEEVLAGDVAVSGGYVAGVGSYSAQNEVDCTGLYLCPGFVDAHIHIESTMVLPAEFVRLALPWGTTTVVADPHEIVNVCGAAGMQFMLDCSENIPCNMFFMLPSSIPSSPHETTGARFELADMRPFAGHARVLGLGEVMAYPEVVHGSEKYTGILNAFAGRPIDGHAPGLSGRELQAYAAGGITTEHECASFAEALEKARAGMAILVREGSAAHNLAAIVGGLLESGHPQDRFMFCTDDKHLEDLRRDGHIRWNVKLAIDLGMPPEKAIRMATLNAASAFGLRDIGAVAPGYRADLVLLSNLKQVTVAAVYKDGVLATQRLAAMPPPPAPPNAILHSVVAPKITPDDLKMPAAGLLDVIGMVPYQIITRHLREEVPARGGHFAPDATYTKLCVVERHGQNGHIAAAPLKGYGIVGGALATTVAHDSHNIIAAGDNDADIALAVGRLRETGGGYVLVQNGRVAGEVPLAVAGLMSTAAAEEVQRDTGVLIGMAHQMGIPYYVDPFISLSFLALPVIPSLRLTDHGLFDVDNGAVITPSHTAGVNT